MIRFWVEWGFDNDEPDLKENLPPKKRGYTNSIGDKLYNQLEEDNDNYESERIVDH